MHHLLSKVFNFNTGTWFSAALFFINEYFNVDLVFKSMISMLSFTLLVLQITNQWHIRKERKIKESNNILIDKKYKFDEFKESLTEDNHENLKK